MKILILGATGTIGTQAISILKELKLRLVGISYHSNIKLAEKIIKKYNLKYFFCSKDPCQSTCKSYEELIKKSQPDIILNSVVGFAGLKATIASLSHKIKILALANKESMVVGGRFINQLAQKNDIKVYPVDSEHCSLMQILINQPKKSIKKIYITASGGPFWNHSKNELKKVTYNQAIKHPKWEMGKKISIDSATLINKVFEIIEAYWYFQTKNIISLLHKEVYIHGLVEFQDHSILAAMAYPDMKMVIAQALTGFKNNYPFINEVNFTNLNMNLKLIGKESSPINLAYDFFNNIHNSYTIVLNAANEIAIQLFKEQKISFDQIVEIINWSLKNIPLVDVRSLNEIFEIDTNTREKLQKQFGLI